MPTAMKLARLIPMPLFAALVYGALGLNIILLSHGLTYSLTNPDEGAHYVNALFIGDWIRAGFPAPMAFARDFYVHFPRLSIGHWPPGWYLLEAPIFALLRPSPLQALLISAFVAGLPGGVVFWAFERIGRRGLGFALGLAYALLPMTVEAMRYVLLDQPVALVVGIAAVAWCRASDDPRWWRMLVFALLAAFAPLVKGNGALIALVPAIDIALTGRWRLLRRPALWVAALLAMVLVAPWYWISFRISAGGFNYAPGIQYAALALGTNLAVIWQNVGPGGIALALYGGWRALRGGTEAETRIARLSIAVIAATLIFQSAVPASLEPRYVAPLLPWVVILAGLGLVGIGSLARPAAAALAAAAVLAMVPALQFAAALQPRPDTLIRTLATNVADGGGVWMVDGRPGDEGGLIAAAAYLDGGRRRPWVLRASQWLSASDFMGRGYRLITPDPASALSLLNRLGVAGVITFHADDRFAYPHSRILMQAVDHADFVTLRGPFKDASGEATRSLRKAVLTDHRLIEEGTLSTNLMTMVHGSR